MTEAEPDDEEIDFEGKEAEVTHGLLTAPIRALHPRAAVCVPLDDTVADAVGRMNAEGIGAVLIVDGNRLVGIFTERDVLRKIAGHGFDFTKIFVRDYMTPDPESLSLEHKLAYALNKMVVGGYRHVPLIDASGKPVAVISVRDIVEFIVERFPQEVINLPPDPDHEMRKAEGG